MLCPALNALWCSFLSNRSDQGFTLSSSLFFGGPNLFRFTFFNSRFIGFSGFCYSYGCWAKDFVCFTVDCILDITESSSISESLSSWNAFEGYWITEAWDEAFSSEGGDNSWMVSWVPDLLTTPDWSISFCQFWVLDASYYSLSEASSAIGSFSIAKSS